MAATVIIFCYPVLGISTPSHYGEAELQSLWRCARIPEPGAFAVASCRTKLWAR
jgi:hypothetical protein